MASSICFGSRSARRTASATALEPNSTAEKLERPPWNFPTGVRTALRNTGVSIFNLRLLNRPTDPTEKFRNFARRRLVRRARGREYPRYANTWLVARDGE